MAHTIGLRPHDTVDTDVRNYRSYAACESAATSLGWMWTITRDGISIYRSGIRMELCMFGFDGMDGVSMAGRKVMPWRKMARHQK